jgi:dGTPase
VKHSRDYSPDQHPELAEYFLDRFPPVEAQMIDVADEIAYLTADLDDGLDSGVLTLEQVRGGVPLFRRFHELVIGLYPHATNKIAVNETLRRVMNALVTDMLAEIRRQVQSLGAETLEDIRCAPTRIALLSPAMEADRAQAKQFLYSQLYNSPGMEKTHEHSALVVRELFDALMADPKQLPPDHQEQIATEGLARTVADYIAGMTDSFIQQNWMKMGGEVRP